MRNIDDIHVEIARQISQRDQLTEAIKRLRSDLQRAKTTTEVTAVSSQLTYCEDRLLLTLGMLAGYWYAIGHDELEVLSWLQQTISKVRKLGTERTIEDAAA